MKMENKSLRSFPPLPPLSFILSFIIRLYVKIGIINWLVLLFLQTKKHPLHLAIVLSIGITVIDTGEAMYSEKVRCWPSPPLGQLSPPAPGERNPKFSYFMVLVEVSTNLPDWPTK